jgi:hypothetical protein
MRKCAVLGIALLAVLSFTLPTQASAQGVFLGAGATIPMGDYGDYAKTGWAVDAGVTFPIGENGLFVFADGMYGSNSHSDHDGDKTNLIGGFGGVEYAFSEPGEAGPFVFGQVGFLRHGFKSDEHPDDDESDMGLAFGGGAGYGFPVGGMNAFVLGRFIQGRYGASDGFEAWTTTFVGVMAGVSIPLGGDAG